MIVVEEHEPAAEEENYFISMTDMMVGLIFIFIIMLMYFVLEFRDVTDKLAGANATRTLILQAIKGDLAKKGVAVEIDTVDGVLHLPNAILFDSADANLKPEGKVVVAKIAEALDDVLPCYTDSNDRAQAVPASCANNHKIESLYIEGHTDQVPMHRSDDIRDNWGLSALRATNTYREMLADKPDIHRFCVTKPNSDCQPVLSVSGYGPDRLVDHRDSDEARQRNRRIDLRLIMVTPDSGQAQSAIAAHLAS